MSQQSVACCGVCQLHGQKPGKVPLQGYIQANRPGQRYALDIVHVNRQPWGKATRQKSVTAENGGGNEDYEYILTCVDICSRWAIAVPLQEITADKVLTALTWHVIGIYVQPEEFICDGGSEFKKDVEQACGLIGIGVHRSVAYHHEGNGVVERFNRTLADTMAKFIEEEHRLVKKEWVEMLPWAVMAYNSSVHKMLSLTASDGLTPAHLFLGRRIDLAIHAATKSPETMEIKKPEQTAVEVQENVLKALSWMQ